MEKRESEAAFLEENARLQKENAYLAREIAIEERVTQRWQALAGIFHDTLWSALRRYDPPYFVKLKNCAQEKPVRVGMETADSSALSQQSEDRTLRQENARLSRALADQKKRHREWEQTAVRFHDTLWQVLLKYEPDTYGAICPAHARETEPDFANLPTFPDERG